MKITSYELPEDIEPETEADRILTMYAQVRPDVDPTDLDQRNLLAEDFDDQEVLVARDDGDDVIGVASYYYPAEKDYAYLSGIAVDRHYQGLGQVGPEMMRHLIEQVRQVGRVAIEGETLPQSRSFYARMGAVAIEGDRIRLDLDESQPTP